MTSHPPKSDAVAALSSCDREPIHIPGAIQPHGILLAMAPGTHEILQVAGDTAAMIGAEPHALLGQTIDAWFEPAEVAHMLDLLQAQRLLSRSLPLLEGVTARNGRRFNAVLHESDGVAILELEPAAGLNRADALAMLKVMNLQIAGAVDADSLCDSVVKAVREATGFDRVMIYQFRPNGSGVVVAEARDAEIEAFLGLHFPASDIPSQARALYLRTWLRLIPDARYTPQPLIPTLNPNTGKPLDLSQSMLRSVSPIHLEYMANMGVAASMSISIERQGQLWGLIACHHRTPHHVCTPLRVACDLFAEMASLRLDTQITTADRKMAIASRRYIQNLTQGLGHDADISDAMARLGSSLLDLVPAESATLWLGGMTTNTGRTPSHEQLTALVKWLNGRDESVFATDRLAELYPASAAFADIACGLLAVVLSDFPRAYALWFLPETIQTVTWGGDPNKAPAAGDSDLRLRPRTSFAAWREDVRLQSRAWRNLEIEAATALRSSFVELGLRQMSRYAREQQEAHGRQSVLSAEVDDRLKNLLATIQTLVSEGEAVEISRDNFLGSFRGRLEAMSRANMLLTKSGGATVDLRQLIEDAVSHASGAAAIGVQIGANVSVSLRAKAAISFHLALHELITNAIQHGALSAPGGAVVIDWRLDQHNALGLVLDWHEAGGPPAPATPPRRGFGLSLAEHSLYDQLGGTMTLAFEPVGLHCTIEIPTNEVIQTLAPGAANTRQKQTLAGARVLLVEDNILVANSVSRSLALAGAIVVGPAARLPAAVEHAGKDAIDVAILDFDLDGAMVWPAADVLARRDIPFFFVTGYQSTQTLPERFKDRPVLNKPFTVQALQSALKRLLTERYDRA